MALVEATREPISVIRARLRNPPNAVFDRGIDLRRRDEPEPVVVVDLPVLPIPPIPPPIDFALERLIRQASDIETAFHCKTDPEVFRRPKISDIIRIVAAFYGVHVTDMLSERRTANVLRPRHIACYLAKELTLHSLPEIGRRMGGRDHTTILHAVRKIALEREQIDRTRDEIQLLTMRAIEFCSTGIIVDERAVDMEPQYVTLTEQQAAFLGQLKGGNGSVSIVDLPKPDRIRGDTARHQCSLAGYARWWPSAKRWSITPRGLAVLQSYHERLAVVEQRA